MSLPIFMVYCYGQSGMATHLYVFSGILGVNDIPMADREYVARTGAEVIFVPMRIYDDDSIRTIKHKLIHAMGAGAVGYGEMYLFAESERHINMADIYESATHFRARKIDKVAFTQIADNLSISTDSNNFNSITETIDFANLIDLQTKLPSPQPSSNSVWLRIPLGREFADEYSYVFAVNPYKCGRIDAEMLDRSAELLTVDNRLILNYGEIRAHTLHLCLAEHVLAFYSACPDTDAQLWITALYFPCLYADNIRNSADLIAVAPTLRARATARVNLDTVYNFKSVDLIREAHISKTANVEIHTFGIRSLGFTWVAARTMSIPTETVFKRISCSPDIPFVRFHPGLGQERILRLFCDKLTDTGKRVPIMKEADMKPALRARLLSKEIMFLHHPLKGGLDTFIWLTPHGDIRVFREPRARIEDFDTEIKAVQNAITRVLKDINAALQYSGHTIEPFESLDHERVTDMSLAYAFEVSGITRANVEILKEIPCIAGIAEIDRIHNRISSANMVYKRVEDYHVGDITDIDAYILEMYNSVSHILELRKMLISRFPALTDSTAEAAIAACIDKYPRIHLKFRENRGFPIQFRASALGRPTLEIDVSQITNVRYIPHLRAYIETILLITQIPTALPHAAELKERTYMRIKAVETAPANVFAISAPTAVQVATLAPITFARDTDTDGDDIGIEGDEEDDFLFDEIADADDDIGETGADVPGLVGGTAVDPATIDDTPLNNPSYFVKRIATIEPTLMLTKTDGKYNSYSRLCQSSTNRQPIIITDAEKAEIDSKHPGSYDKALRYGSDPAKPYWYICPRYWCLLTNTSMTETEAKSGSCGKIIPYGSASVPKGHYVLQSSGDPNTENYIPLNPGFLKEGLHPDGHCMACCYVGKWDSEHQIKRRKECNPAEYGVAGKDAATGDPFYIMSAGTRVDRGRWAFLPEPVQAMMHISYASAMSSPHAIKAKHRVLLEYGVDDSVSSQAFMGCVAEMLAHARPDSAKISVSSAKKILATAISLDEFVQYNNGNLVLAFAQDPPPESCSILKYKTSETYKRVNPDNLAQYRALLAAVSAFDAFKEYLLHPSDPIDHTHLWDILCTPNPAILPHGCNILMLRIPDDDGTQNVDIVCPTNAYSNVQNDPDKDTFVILLRADATYSMMFFYNETAGKGRVLQVDRVMSRTTMPASMIKILHTVHELSSRHCRPSVGPRTRLVEYTYAPAMPAREMRDILTYYGARITGQVLNYQHKVVGLRVSVPNSSTVGMVPTRPSPIDSKLQSVFLDQFAWLPYASTIQFLREISQLTAAKIPCAPLLTVIDDAMAVGILTSSNQFVQFAQPVELRVISGDGIPTITGPNYITAERSAGEIGDPIRRAIVRRITLENAMYSSFRALVRQRINNPLRADIRAQIAAIAASKDMLYENKLAEMVAVLRTAVKSVIQFADMTTIITETDADPAIAVEVPPRTCFVSNTADTGAILYISSINLINGANNEHIYFIQMADELVRYTRIRKYMLDTHTRAIPDAVAYQVRPHEIIILQSLLANYTSHMRIVNFNPRIKRVFYESARAEDAMEFIPRAVIDITNGTDMQVGLSDDYALMSHDACIADIRPVKGNRTTSIWVRTFGAKSQEIVFKTDYECSFTIVMFILSKSYDWAKVLHGIKQRIWSKYIEHISMMGEIAEHNIVNLLGAQGKVSLVTRIRRGEVSLETAIASADYYLSELDLCAIFEDLDTPVILFYVSRIMDQNTDVWRYLNGPNKAFLLKQKPIHFIRAPARSAIIPNVPSAFSLITPAFELSELGRLGDDIREAAEQGAAHPNIRSFRNILETHVVLRRTA